MTTSKLHELGFCPVCEGEEKEITGGFCGDLLSWAMGSAQEGQVWFTVMGNIDTIAVACLADVAAVVLCHGAALADDARARAAAEGVNLYTTSLPEFEAAAAFARAFAP